MKALIRNDEIICEPWDQWIEDHIEWLITPRPNGDGYTLIDGYDPEKDSELSYEELQQKFSACI